MIHYNHGPILYCFRDKRRFWLRIAYVSHPVYFTPPLRFPMAGAYLRGWLLDQTPEMLTSKFFNTISACFCSCSCQYCYHIKQKYCIFFSPMTLKKCWRLRPGLCLPRTRLCNWTFRGHANSPAVDDSRKDVSRTRGTIRGQTVKSHC